MKKKTSSHVTENETEVSSNEAENGEILKDNGLAQNVEPNGSEVAATDAAALPATAAEPKTYGDKVLSKKEKRKRTAVNWALMIVGIIMMSASVYFFQTPNDLTLGGIAGIAIVLNKLIEGASPEVAAILTQGVIMAIINVLLLILGLIILGKQCTIKTIFCSLFYTGIIWLFEYINVIGYLAPEGQKTLTDQPLLELVYAILLFGVGGALIFNCGASSGGTDIIALILKKFTKINVGMAWIGSIMGEYLVSKAGLGYLIVYGGQVFKMDLVMACTIVLCILAGGMYFLVALFEKFMVNKWRD